MKYEATKNKAGEPGADAVEYWMAATPTEILYDPNTGEKTTNEITIEFYKQVGQNEPEVITASDNLYYTLSDFAHITKITGPATIDVSAITSSFTVVMYSSNDISTAKKYDNETISYVTSGVNGKKGDKGESAFYIDVDNDYEAIPADSDGTISDAYNWEATQHVIRVYNGTEQIEFKTPEGTINRNTTASYELLVESHGVTCAGATYDSTNKTFTQHITSLSDDTGYIQFILKTETGSILATAKFEAVKNKAGMDGASPIIYNIISNATTVLVPQSGDRVPNGNIKVTFTKTVGTTTENLTTCAYRYKVDGGNWTNKTALSAETQYPIALAGTANANSNIDIELYTDTDDSAFKLDAMTISVVKDGAQGATGVSVTAVVTEYYLQSTNPSDPTYREPYNYPQEEPESKDSPDE